MPADSDWNRSYSREIDATSDMLWQAFADMAHWKLWNAGVSHVTAEGGFVTGTWFSMELPDGASIRSQLTLVTPPELFVDETRVGETLVRVEHRIEPLRKDRCRVTYTIMTYGPGAETMGEAISADFPDVLDGLARYVNGSAV